MIATVTEATAMEVCKLQLYVVGTSPRTSTAVTNIRKFCDSYYGEYYRLEVIDISIQPELAESANILAAPTLVRSLPLPIRRVVGDMSDTERVLSALNRW